MIERIQSWLGEAVNIAWLALGALCTRKKWNRTRPTWFRAGSDHMKLLLICLLIVLGSYAHAQDSEDLQIKLITGSNRAVYDKCASLNPEKYRDKPFDNDNPVVCIAYTRDPPSCTIYSPEPVSDEEWQVERHLCIEIARHVMLEQERGT